jgi:hypothetical protein
MGDKMAGSKGKRVVCMAIEMDEDAYAVARLRVPYCPEVMEVNTPEDVFTLYWRFTKKKRMAYVSSIYRSLPTFDNHVDKVMSEIVMRKCSHLFLQRDAREHEFIQEIRKRSEALGITVLLVSYDTTKGLPPGITKEDGMMQCRAWRRLHQGLDKIFATEIKGQRLERWDPDVALGGDGETAVKRAAKRGKAHAEGADDNRYRSREMRERKCMQALDDLRTGKITIKELTGKDHIKDFGVSAVVRKNVNDAVEEGIVARGRAALAEKRAAAKEQA